MRVKIFVGICILASSCGIYYLLHGQSPSPPLHNPALTTKNEHVSADAQSPSSSGSVPHSKQIESDFSSVLTPQERDLLATGYTLTPEEREQLSRRKRQKDFVPTLEEIAVMGETPVEFYGQVLDQFDSPVVGAKIRCTWGIYGQQVSPVETKSAAPNGQFEIVGIKAVSIGVSVYPPPGYDEQVKVSKDIQIAKTPDRILKNEDYKKLTHEQKELMTRSHGSAEAYKGDKAKPVIFRLKNL
jgi:hypothetical protein